jgi:hypothetical protein
MAEARLTRERQRFKTQVQKCKSAYGLCKGANVKVTYRVAGGSPGWQVAESVFPTAYR